MRDNFNIQIQPVANGFVVYLPQQPSFKLHGMDVGKLIGKIMPGRDRALEQAEDQLDEAKQNDLATFTDHSCFIFKTFGEALAFLQVTYDGGE